jgi:hypothetical protein
MAAVSDATRLALFLAWGQRCVWCKLPLTFRDMEVEHLIPKSLADEKLTAVLTQHGLPDDYDLYATANLAPSCGGCNSGKGARLPPDTPIVSLLLELARERAPKIEADAQAFATQQKVDVALGVIMATAESGALDGEAKSMLRDAVDTLAPVLEDAFDSDATFKVALHPAMSLLFEPTRWRIVSVQSPEVATVSDGRVGGFTGTHWSFACSYCGSHGPWNGIICLTCGQRDPPDW